MRATRILLTLATTCFALTAASPLDSDVVPRAKHAASCFPALDFVMPSTVPADSELSTWWCNTATEYAFLGFSYEVTACQSRTKLISDFKDARQRFKARYVRLYGFCDRKNFYDDIVEAAWQSTLGVHSLVWFGWDDPNAYIPRRDALLGSLHSNPKAKWVTRYLYMGSEPLYDWVLPVADLKREVLAARANLSSLRIPVTFSELAWGFQFRSSEGTLDLLANLDAFAIHMLPFFSQTASTANNSWPIVLKDLNWFVGQNTKGKKMYLSQNGWPALTYPGVEPNSPDAANVQNEKDYFNLLDSQCAFFKAQIGGGVGWFAHIYSESHEPGYGIVWQGSDFKYALHPKLIV